MEQSPVDYKVIIQLSNNDALVQKVTIGQLNNILNAFDKVSVEVVMNGLGIDLVLQESPFTNILELQHQKGIHFTVCRNTTLNQKNLSAAALLPFVTIVPSALAHIIMQQHEGWSYIKAGN